MSQEFEARQIAAVTKMMDALKAVVEAANDVHQLCAESHMRLQGVDQSDVQKYINSLPPIDLSVDMDGRRAGTIAAMGSLDEIGHLAQSAAAFKASLSQTGDKS